MIHDLDSDHLPILLTIPLPPVFHPNDHPPSFNFQKACWNDFVYYFDSRCPSAEEYSSLSSASLLFTSLTVNAAKSIPFGRVNCHSKAWYFAEVEGAVSERRKAFTAAHRSDEDRQAYISVSRRASLVIAKAKAEAWKATYSSLLPKSNPKSVYSLLRSVAGSSSSSPNFPQLFLSQAVGFGLRQLPEIPLFCLPPNQRLCVAEPKATFPSSAKPHALRILTRTFAPPSPTLNFLQLPLFFPRPLPLAQTKLLIPC